MRASSASEPDRAAGIGHGRHGVLCSGDSARASDGAAVSGRELVSSLLARPTGQYAPHDHEANSTRQDEPEQRIGNHVVSSMVTPAPSNLRRAGKAA